MASASRSGQSVPPRTNPGAADAITGTNSERSLAAGTAAAVAAPTSDASATLADPPSTPAGSLGSTSGPARNYNLSDSATLEALFPHLLGNIRLSQLPGAHGPSMALPSATSSTAIEALGGAGEWEMGLVQALPHGAPDALRPGGGAGSPAERTLRLSHPLLARLSPSMTAAETPPTDFLVAGASAVGSDPVGVDGAPISDGFSRPLRRALQLSPDTRRWGRVIDHGELALPLVADSGSPMDIDAILGGSFAGDGPSDGDEGSDGSEDDDEDDELDINWHADPLWRDDTVRHQQPLDNPPPSPPRRSNARRSQPGHLSAGASGEAWMDAVWSVPLMHNDEHPLHGSDSLASGGAIGRSGHAVPRGQVEQRAEMRRLQDRKERQVTPTAVWVAGKGKTAAGKDLPDGLPTYLRRHPHLHNVQPADADLPTHFSPTDHSPLLAVSTSGFRASYVPLRSRNDRDAASVRANLPIPVSVGLFYFEVEIVDAGQRGYIGVGLSGRTVNLGRLPGWERSSWGYHGDDGMVFGEKGQGREFGPGFTTGDVIGCGLDIGQGAVFYTKNGILLGHVFQGLNCEGLYPTIGLRTPREEVRANFGQFPFRFDIDGYYAERQRTVLSSVLAASARPALSSSLAPPTSNMTDADQKRLAQLRSELRVKRTAAEDGHADWNALSGLQRAVWDLLDKSEEPQAGSHPVLTVAAAVSSPASATTSGTEKKAVEKGSRGKSAQGKMSVLKSKMASADPATARVGVEGSDAIRSLVGEYLSHQGFSATLAAFNCNSTPAAPAGAGTLVEQKASTILDRKYRHMIVCGRLDSAIGMLEKRYPAILASNVGFALQCAKLVQLITGASATSVEKASRQSRNRSNAGSQGELASHTKKRKASLSADLTSDGASQPPGKAFRSSAHPDLSPSTSPPVQLSTAHPSTASPLDPVAEDVTDRILAYARSLAALARPGPLSGPSATHNSREELLNACIGLLAFADLKKAPTVSQIGDKCLSAWRLSTAQGLAELADQIEERILDAEDVERESALEAVLKHTLAVHEQMGAANLGSAAFVDVAEHLIPS